MNRERMRMWIGCLCYTMRINNVTILSIKLQTVRHRYEYGSEWRYSCHFTITETMVTYKIGSYLLPNIYNVIKWKSSRNRITNILQSFCYQNDVDKREQVLDDCLMAQNGYWIVAFTFQLCWYRVRACIFVYECLYICLYLLIWLKIEYVSRCLWSYFMGIKAQASGWYEQIRGKIIIITS